MFWFIQDYDELKIYFTNGWQEFYVPKFRISYEVIEPHLTIIWTDLEIANTPQRSLTIDYQDVVGGYGGYVDDPTSAQDLMDILEGFERSAFGSGGLTADEIDAIQNAESPSAGNPFMTNSAVLALLASSGILFTPDLFSDDNELGIGTNRTLASLGYNNGTAAVAWPKVNADPRFTIDVDEMFIDWIALQECFLAMEQTCNSWMYSPGGRAYMVNQTVFWPRNQNNWAGSGSAGTRSLDKYEFQWCGSGVFNGTDDNFPTMDRFPTDQTEAVSDYLNTTFIIHNLWVGGNDNDLASVDNIAFRLAASTKSQLNNCTFSNATALSTIYFGIGGEVNNCQWYNWGSYGLLLSNGRDGDAFGGGWSGGGTSDCQTNQTIVSNPRFVLTTNTSLAACYHFGGYRAKVVNPIVEGIGGDPETVTMFHYLASGDGVEQLFDIEGLSVENLVCTRAGIRIEAEKGMTNISKCALYLGDPENQMPVFVEGDNRVGSSGQPMIFLDNQYTNRMYRSVDTAGEPSQQFRWIFKDTYAVDYTDIFDAANWATDFGGFIPDTDAVRYTPPLVVV